MMNGNQSSVSTATAFAQKYGGLIENLNDEAFNHPRHFEYSVVSSNRPVRGAIVSGLFNWPSSGGGNVHTVELARALKSANYALQHFYLHFEPWMIGAVNNSPIGSVALPFNELDWSLRNIQSRLHRAMGEYGADFVILTDCWSLKPWLAEAVNELPYILRFDGMECLCPLNNLRVIPHPDHHLEPCPKHRLATPGACVRCVNQHAQFVGARHKWEREFSRFQTNEYHDLLLGSLSNAEAVLVHNPLIATMLEPYANKVLVVPIGVNAHSFGTVPALRTDWDSRNRVKRILFSGRTNDWVKGFQVLRSACEKLWRTRQDFRLIATGSPDGAAAPFAEWIGWQCHDDMPSVLASIEIVAAPAIASEPFGLSVVEAMAAARPVVASRVGGQQFTVVEDVTGLLCQPDDPEDLADKLSHLLDSADLRASLGNAGRRRFEAEYSWDTVIERYYKPLLQIKTDRGKIC